jgi:repressor LexA
MRLLQTKIKTLRLQKGLTQEEMAAMLKVSRATYTRYETGHRMPDYATIQKIAQFFRVSMDFLCGDTVYSDMSALAGTGLEVYPPEEQTLAPIYGVVKAGYGGLATEDFLGYEAVDTDALAGNPEDFFWLKVKGDSMSPFIEAGDFVLVRRQQEANTGQIVIAILDGEEGTVKKFRRCEDFVELIPLNPLYDAQQFAGQALEQVQIIGIVREIKRKLK